MKGPLLYNDGRNILSLQCLNPLQTKIIKPVLNQYHKEDQATYLVWMWAETSVKQRQPSSVKKVYICHSSVIPC